MPVTIDRFVEDRRSRWSRLAALVGTARGNVSRLRPDDVLELGHLYRATTGDLAIARRDYARDAVTERLNDLVAAAHALVYSEAPTSGRRLRRYFASELPATVRANLRFTLVAFGFVLVPALFTYASGLVAPELAASALSEETRRSLVGRQPGSEIPVDFRALAGPVIIVNNVRVAAVAFAGGMTAGALTAYVLIENGAMLGTIFAVLQHEGVAGNLLTFILGHGFLELSAIFLSAGAGLQIAWALLRPGERSRGDSLRLAGAQAARTLLLTVIVLFVAGIIEAFVSPTSLPFEAKLAVGLVTGTLLWGYIALGGRRLIPREQLPSRQ